MTVTKDDDRGVLAADDRLVERAADAWDVEDALGDDRADHQDAEVDAEEGDDRDQRVAQDVHRDDPLPRKALARRGAHEVLAVSLDDRRPRQAHDLQRS